MSQPCDNPPTFDSHNPHSACPHPPTKKHTGIGDARGHKGRAGGLDGPHLEGLADVGRGVGAAVRRRRALDAVEAAGYRHLEEVDLRGPAAQALRKAVACAVEAGRVGAGRHPLPGQAAPVHLARRRVAHIIRVGPEALRAGHVAWDDVVGGG